MSPAKDKDTEKQILEAAVGVVLRKGKGGVRMQEIADEAGVNKALLHYYFRSKEKIYQAVLSQVIGRLFKTLMVDLDETSDLEVLLKTFIDRHIALIIKNRRLISFFLGEIGFNLDDIIRAIKSNLTINKQPILAFLAGKIDEAVENGIIRPVDPVHLLINIISMNVFYFIFSPLVFNVLDIAEEEQDRISSERSDQVFEFVWHSLRPVKDETDEM